MASPTPLQIWAWLCLLYLKLWFSSPHSEPSCIHMNWSSHLSYSDSRSCGSLCFKSFSRLWLCDLMDCSPPDSSVHGDSPGRILEWVAISSSRGSSQTRDHTQVSLSAGGFFTVWAAREADWRRRFLGHLQSHTCPLLWPLLRAHLASVSNCPLLAPLTPIFWLIAAFGGVSVMTDLLFLLHREYPPHTCHFSESWPHSQTCEEGGSATLGLKLEINLSVLSFRWPGKEKQKITVWNIHGSFMAQRLGSFPKFPSIRLPALLRVKEELIVTKGLEFSINQQDC